MKMLLLVLGVASMAAGAVFMAIAAIGLVRLPDVFLRSHAASKAATLSVCLVLVGTAMTMGHSGGVARAALAIGFVLTTVPVATQLLVRAAYQGGAAKSDDTWTDPRDES